MTARSTVLSDKIAALVEGHLQEMHTAQELTERLVSGIPFVQRLISENSRLKSEIRAAEMERRRVPNNISLEISESVLLPSTRVVNMDIHDLRAQHLQMQDGDAIRRLHECSE